MRFEVIMSDGWKVRVNADNAREAAEKAERMNKYGDKAVSVTPCGEVPCS